MALLAAFRATRVFVFVALGWATVVDEGEGGGLAAVVETRLSGEDGLGRGDEGARGAGQSPRDLGRSVATQGFKRGWAGP